LYEFDGEWYEGTIKKIGNNEVLVEYVGYDEEAWLGLGTEVKPRTKKIGSREYYEAVTIPKPHPIARTISAPPISNKTKTPQTKKSRTVDTPPHQPQRKRSNKTIVVESPALRKTRSEPLYISKHSRTPQKTKLELPSVAEKVKDEEEEEEKEVHQPIKIRVRSSLKKRLTLVVVGHVDAGKSTLMGHLLYDLDVVSKKTMRKFEKQSKESGKASFKYAWVLDENAEERERGVTMEVASRDFETTKTLVTLLDSPGHKDFVPSMITGASSADAALLVVAASRGEFEAGFSDTGQTREHAILISSLGVKHLIVVINKLDSVEWSQSRFEEIRKHLESFLLRLGFKSVRYVPVSGLNGVNIVKTSKDVPLLKWYKGPTLIDAIDTFETSKRMDDSPPRLFVSDVYPHKKDMIRVYGKISAGSIGVNDHVLLMPLNLRCTVKSVSLRDESVNFGCCGENVSVQIAGVPDPQLVKIGSAISSISRPIHVSPRFRAKIFTLNMLRNPVIAGQRFILHYQCFEIPCNVTKLLRLLDSSTGKLKRKKPRTVTKNQLCAVVITTIRPICIEAKSDFPTLGRFVLRDRGVTIASGAVLKVLKEKKKR